MKITVTHTLDGLERDFRRIPPAAKKDMREVTRTAARLGNEEAKRFAQRSAGEHGKHYHRAFTWEGRGSLFGGAGYSAEYGPVVGRPQGGMSFEGGSRNQPPHNDLAKSADFIGPVFAKEVGDRIGRWFWLGAD